MFMKNNFHINLLHVLAYMLLEYNIEAIAKSTIVESSFFLVANRVFICLKRVMVQNIYNAIAKSMSSTGHRSSTFTTFTPRPLMSHFGMVYIYTSGKKKQCIFEIAV